ncbi:Haloacid dehalogenase-like hydrolase domain-containing protein 3 [Coemansia erecta]|uniref:Haloacid dehalogenase-like hydrolase domain-containing protein 3 n=1 Tax=Coemansia erecta TaxID=147472 RepID=A0A9W8CR48_9FUNG|nr:Haloacid dehalogenase-like hydrolase domain-containing protein 3 [Coemansia erecta]
MSARAVKRFGHIRLITFDIFDTLYKPSVPVSRTYAEPLRKLGIKVDEQNVARAFAQAFKQTHTEYPNYGREFHLTSSDWWTLVIKRTWTNAGVDLAVHPELCRAIAPLIEHFGSGRGYVLFPEVPKVLKHIRRKGVKMGVISNMDESGETVLRHLGIREYFDFVMKSVTTGIEKPDARAFAMALAAVSVPAYDALHIGDSERCDYLPARRAGMEALLVCRDRVPDSVAYSEDIIPGLNNLIAMI